MVNDSLLRCLAQFPGYSEQISCLAFGNIYQRCFRVQHGHGHTLGRDNAAVGGDNRGGEQTPRRGGMQVIFPMQGDVGQALPGQGKGIAHRRMGAAGLPGRLGVAGAQGRQEFRIVGGGPGRIEERLCPGGPGELGEIAAIGHALGRREGRASTLVLNQHPVPNPLGDGLGGMALLAVPAEIGAAAGDHTRPQPLRWRRRRREQAD